MGLASFAARFTRVLTAVHSSGPYDLGTWSRLFLMVRDGTLAGAPAGARTFAHVREVVVAHVAAADRGEGGACYILGGTNASMLDLVQALAQLLGKPIPTRETPAVLVKALAAVSDVASRFTGREPTVTPEMAEAFGRTLTATSVKAQRELGFKVLPLQEMVRDCYEWMKAEGRI